MPSDDAELLLPFVVCQSQGGPFDDDAYTAGFETATLWVDLERSGPALHTVVEVTVHTANVPQIDLVAMHHGYSITAFQDAPQGADGWTALTLTHHTALRREVPDAEG